MRLYIKLIIILAAVVAAEVHLEPASTRDLWFALRCEFASKTGDDRLMKALVLEAMLRDQAAMEDRVHVQMVNASHG